MATKWLKNAHYGSWRRAHHPTLLSQHKPQRHPDYLSFYSRNKCRSLTPRQENLLIATGRDHARQPQESRGELWSPVTAATHSCSPGLRDPGRRDGKMVRAEVVSPRNVGNYNHRLSPTLKNKTTKKDFTLVPPSKQILRSVLPQQ